MDIMRKSHLTIHKQDRLIEHFVAGTTARYFGLIQNRMDKIAYVCHAYFSNYSVVQSWD